MAQGGKRAGAGRPKGRPNKATSAKAAAIALSGDTPLDFLLNLCFQLDEVSKLWAPPDPLAPPK